MREGGRERGRERGRQRGREGGNEREEDREGEKEKVERVVERSKRDDFDCYGVVWMQVNWFFRSVFVCVFVCV